MADVLAALTSGSDDLYEEVIRENLNNRILIFNQEVNDSLIEDYIMYILKWNREDRDIEDISKRKEITIILNSCGGDCFIGFGGMVNCIENSKTPIKVIGIGLVASMAFYIYICAKKRYAFKNTILLMHDGELSAQSSGGKFKDVALFFENMDKRTKDHVLKYTNMTEEFYDSQYDREYYVYANDAKKLGCVDYIIGEDCTLDDIL